jgi:hypothetical protein
MHEANDKIALLFRRIFRGYGCQACEDGTIPSPVMTRHNTSPCIEFI